ncbi:unnamed protein product [Ectocarpus sp. 8 AP-2014]
MQYHDGKNLPPGWVRCVSSKFGRDYFFDTQTGESTWFAPATPPPPPPSRQGGEEEDLESFSPPPAKRSRQERPSSLPPQGGGKTKVAVVVPYRDLDPAQRRSAHLEQFVPYMEDFLERAGGAGGEFRVYVVEQSADDGLKFNRGKLLNIGFDLARKEGAQVFLLHDVDLLPSNELARWYATVPERPVHVARVWKQYSNNPK